MDKCHYNKGEFVPCETMDLEIEHCEIGINAEKEFYIAQFDCLTIGFCPFCGESLKQPESVKPWWVVPGMVVKNNIDYVRIVEKDDKYLYAVDKLYKPIGGPFDMVPEWATHIQFGSDGSSSFLPYENQTYDKDVPVWHDCPEEFKGKTFSLEGLK